MRLLYTAVIWRVRAALVRIACVVGAQTKQIICMERLFRTPNAANARKFTREEADHLRRQNDAVFHTSIMVGGGL